MRTILQSCKSVSVSINASFWKAYEEEKAEILSHPELNWHRDQTKEIYFYESVKSVAFMLLSKSRIAQRQNKIFLKDMDVFYLS